MRVLRHLLYLRKRDHLALFLGFNATGIFFGAAGFGEPTLTYILQLSLAPLILLFAHLNNLCLVKRRGEIPSGCECLSYIKRLSTVYAILGGLSYLPWTIFIVWYLGSHHPEEVPRISQVHQILFAAAIVAIFYFIVGFLTYSSSHIIDPVYDPCRPVSSRQEYSFKEALKNPSERHVLKALAIGFIFFLAIFAPASYVEYVLLGKEYFPYPYLLLSIIAIYLILFPTVFGRVLMYRGEKRVEGIISGEKVDKMSVKYCPYCGAEIPPGIAFCLNCDVNLEKATPTDSWKL